VSTRMTERNAFTRSSRGALSIGDARADILHKALLDAVRSRTMRRQDIPGVARVAGWTDAIRDAAIDTLVARGTLLESATGELVVLPGRPEAA